MKAWVESQWSMNGLPVGNCSRRLNGEHGHGTLIARGNIPKRDHIPIPAFPEGDHWKICEIGSLPAHAHNLDPRLMISFESAFVWLLLLNVARLHTSGVWIFLCKWYENTNIPWRPFWCSFALPLMLNRFKAHRSNYVHSSSVMNCTIFFSFYEIS